MLQLCQEMELQVAAITAALPIVDSRLQSIKAETAKDPAMQKLRKYIKTGWPKDFMNEPDGELGEFATCKADIYEHDGLLFKGSAIIIPTSLRKLMLDKVHFAHQGLNKCKAKARGVLFWPKMNSEITDLVQQCQICCQFQSAKIKEPLQQFPIPESPWSMIAADAFEYRRANYLLLHGAPQVIISDPRQERSYMTTDIITNTEQDM
ncbi:hypothetical protein FOCC_FOCC015790 [Frankliniella occidentalis]|nr:hypothetical protein FOCC_FOCC015790 [Frankliniella occidentalis]